MQIIDSLRLSSGDVEVVNARVECRKDVARAIARETRYNATRFDPTELEAPLFCSLFRYDDRTALKR